MRSRWTNQYLYFLFICPYQQLNLKPQPKTDVETNELWNWDVAEAFIGSDMQNIRKYKEFEVSPRGEWVDLDINLDTPHHEDGWIWNSGFTVAARIDELEPAIGFQRVPLVHVAVHQHRSFIVMRGNSPAGTAERLLDRRLGAWSVQIGPGLGDELRQPPAFLGTRWQPQAGGGSPHLGRTQAPPGVPGVVCGSEKMASHFRWFETLPVFLRQQRVIRCQVRH